MTISEFGALYLLLVVGCITPGPNNALLSASGMNFGYKRSIPHMLGVIFGHGVMEFSVALGLGAIYLSFPIFETVLQYVAVGLLLWFAYKIATAPVDKLATAQNEIKPWTFVQAFVFQWVNPKAWLIAIGVCGKYAGGENPVLTAFYILLATVLAGMISANFWTGFGVAMSRILNTPTKRRIFNLILAGLLIVSIIMLLGGEENEAITMLTSTHATS